MTPKLLIIEDDEAIQMLLQQYFESEGYQIRTASDGKVAWKILEIWEPDILITDLLMPHLDGAGLYGELKESRFKNIPVVFISGAKHIYHDFIDNNWHRHNSIFFEKPIELHRLRHGVQNLLSLAREIEL